MQYTTPLSYNPVDITALTNVLSRYQHAHHTMLVQDFENAITDLTGVHTVALNSGTAAIHLAMKILGVGKGDVILAPSFTYIATVNPALYLGAKPIFIDSLPDTWNMDPKLLEKAIQDAENQGIKPKAIIVTHTYGMPADLGAITGIAEKYAIPVIEDAAESFGSTYHGRSTGTVGRVGIFSFNNNKTFTTYGGGALITPDAELAQKARFFASQARENLPYYEFHDSGFNYLMGPLNAAYGLSQLEERIVRMEKRRHIFEVYREALAGQKVEFQLEKPEMMSNRWFSAILFKNRAVRTRVAESLAGEGIETRPLWRPMHDQPLFRENLTYNTGVSDNLFERGLCLPCCSWMTEKSQERVVNLILRAIGYH